ncbi:hypothetical protein ABIA85_006560 [Bradyrhizobium sp. LA6.10]|uniref:hypothetical protein n=1 Tax=Bradyrhizobium sp. LA6.10 TaxID=3156318 RepID=UPI00339961D5
MGTIQTFTVFTYPPFYLCLILVALLSIRDFCITPTGEDIRLFVTRRRYVVGAGCYALCATFPFCLLVPWVAQVIQVWLLGQQQRDTLSGEAISIAGISFLLISSLAPNLPLLGNIVSKLRAYAQSVAFFPWAKDNLLVLLDRSEFTPNDAARQSVTSELAQYGATRKGEIEKYLVVPLSMAAEIEALRLCLQQRGLHGSNSDFNTLTNKLARVYGAQFAELDLRRSQMFGRLAQALLVMGALDQLLAASKLPEQQRVFVRAANSLSCVIEDIAGGLLFSYRRAIVSFSLSKISTAKKRSSFLRAIGYSVPDQLSLPFWPIVASFAIVLVGMAIPPIILGQRALIQQVGNVAFYAIFANQAVIHSICIWLAIWPKYHFNSARPSLIRLPLRSYAALAVAAYLSSVVLTIFLLLAFPRLPFAAYAPRSYLIQSIIPTCYSLLVAIRMDHHLLRALPVGWKDRLVDAVIFAASIAVAQLIVANLFRYLVPELPRPSYLISILPDNLAVSAALVGASEYTLIFASIAAIIGFAVPATSSDAVIRNSPARQRALVPGGSQEPSLSRAIINVRPRA